MFFQKNVVGHERSLPQLEFRRTGCSGLLSSSYSEEPPSPVVVRTGYPQGRSRAVWVVESVCFLGDVRLASAVSKQARDLAVNSTRNFLGPASPLSDGGRLCAVLGCSDL